jgi:hypothetical protein
MMNPVVKIIDKLTKKRTRLRLKRAELSREIEQTEAALKEAAAQLTQEPERTPEPNGETR